MKPTFFPTAAAFRRWLAKNHASSTELLVGLHKIGSGRPSMTWPESVDQALCFGWIDGVRKRIDDFSYSIRFTPRKAVSNWSAINIARATELKRAGLMRSAGLKAFKTRREDKSRIYAYEQQTTVLHVELERRLKANSAAWKFFSVQAPSYRKLVNWHVQSAKKEETREARIEKIVAVSAAEKRL